MGITEIGGGGMVWTDLAHDSDQWRTLVNTLMNVRVPKYSSIWPTYGF
jgi:hypothetical protein